MTPQTNSVAIPAENGAAWKFRFTVLTATYNRAHTLHVVYESLCAQTLHDFEWLIVDDGSTDETAKLVASWQPPFTMRYVQKTNGGKHTAINLGARLAEGEWILIFDSDDRCIPTALERFDYHVSRLPDDRFANVSCLCVTPDGTVVGGRYPGGELVDVYGYTDQIRFRSCERWGINRTDVLREFPYPEGERYAPEAIVWNRMSRKYAARFINEGLRLYEPNVEGISSGVTKLRVSSPKSTLMFYRELALSPAPLKFRVRATINYFRFLGIDLYRKLFRIKSLPAKQNKAV